MHPLTGRSYASGGLSCRVGTPLIPNPGFPERSCAPVMQKRGQIGSIKVYPFDRIEEAITDLSAGASQPG